MQEILADFIGDLPYFAKILAILLVSMLPIVELRGAIPIGAIVGVEPWLTVVLAIVGNLLPIPFILLFIKKIFAWMRKKSEKLNKVVDKMEAKAEKNKEKVMRYAFWGLVLFVAVPLPGTGGWTGALVAAMIDMPPKRAFVCVLIGVLIAAVIVSFITYGTVALFF